VRASLTTLSPTPPPPSRVEESFHLQATHDFLIHRTRLSAYDHRDFDGGGGGQVVSRSFLGALLLAAGSLPAAAAVYALGLPKLFLQLGVRLTLAWAVCSAVRAFSRAAARRSGWGAGVGVLLCAAASPHYMFYASRTLPNTFASILVASCATFWVRLPPALAQPRGGGGGGGGGWREAAARALCGWAAPRAPLRAAVGSLALALVWFRCDMLVLIGPVAASWLLAGRATLPQLAALGACIGGAAVLVSVLFDSVMWGRLLWPEAEVLYKNVFQGVMNNYEDAKQPWHFYFSKALPLGLLGALPLLPFGFVTWARAPRSAAAFLASLRPDAAVCELALPALAFIGVYSIPANKQVRFVLPAFPLLFFAAGAGAARLAALAAWLWSGEGGEAAAPAAPAAAAPPGAPSGSKRAVSIPRQRRGSGGGGAPPPPAAAACPHPPAAPSLRRRALGAAIFLALGGLALGSAAGAVAFGATAARNYPGGVALQRLFTIVARDSAREAGAQRPARRTAAAAALPPLPPPCPEGDVTGRSGAQEWWRRCLLADGCPAGAAAPWLMPAPAPRNGSRACAPLGEPAAPHTLHVSNLAAQTGVSRFGEGWAPAGATWRLSKTEKLAAADYAERGYKFLIAESEDAGGAAYERAGSGEEGVVEGRPSIVWRSLFAWPPRLEVRTQPQLYLLKRVG